MINKIIIAGLAIAVLGGGAVVVDIMSLGTNDEDTNMSTNTESNQNSMPTLVVYKSPDCGCCSNWVSYVKRRGYKTEIIDTDSMTEVKDQYGIPDDLTSCHTTITGNYFIEGHIPTEAIDKLLADQPDIKGIAMADMPAGSPGMPGNKLSPFEIYAVTLIDKYDEIFMEI